jgi:hypothetical protein
MDQSFDVYGASIYILTLSFLPLNNTYRSIKHRIGGFIHFSTSSPLTVLIVCLHRVGFAAKKSYSS